MIRRRRIESWKALGLGLGGLFAFVSILHALSPVLPGPAGAVFCNNLAEEIEASALLYTETGDMNDYLDPSNGKYGGGQPGDRRE